MKKLLLLVCLTIFSISAFSERKIIEGSLKPLYGEEKLYITFGESDDANFQILNDEEKQNMLRNFAFNANNSIKKSGLVILPKDPEKSSKYLFVISPINIDNDGEIKAIGELIEVESKSSICKIKLGSDHGGIGSDFIAKLTATCRVIGEEFGDELFWVFRKAKKEAKLTEGK